VYTFFWRLLHPSAFRRPVAYWMARVSGRLAGGRAVAAVTLGAAMAPGVCVVIPSRNGRELLERLFASLLPQRPEQIVVVDNGSTDGSAEWLRGQGVEVEECAEPLSFAAAVNRGIARSRYAHTCLLNNDMVLEAGFFAALSRPFDSNPGLFAATAQIFFPSGVRREETGKAMYHRNKTGQFPLWCETPYAGEDGTWVLYGSGGCTLYDTVKLRALGGIGEQYTPAYVEDLDIGWRAWRQGWPTVFAAGARLLHLHRSTTSKYYSAQDLDDALERNYLQFAAGAGAVRRVAATVAAAAGDGGGRGAIGTVRRGGGGVPGGGGDGADAGAGGRAVPSLPSFARGRGADVQSDARGGAGVRSGAAGVCR
jgi:GT2 family glycosyltransferase